MKSSMIKQHQLFNGIEIADELINEIILFEKLYKKDEFIFSIGDACNYIALLVEGTAHVQQLDFYGNQSIVTSLHEGEVFAEAFACSSSSTMPVQVTAITNCIVFFTSYEKLANAAQSYHLIQNLILIIANKNIQMAQRMEVLSKRTIREKLFAYFSLQKNQAKSTILNMPFNRQQLADFLCINRSALSRELSNMQKDELIYINKSVIQLK